MKSFYSFVPGIFALGTILISGCATSNDMSTLDGRLSGIERRYYESEKMRDQFQYRMEDFRKSQIDQDGQIRSQNAELYAIIERLKDDIQKLNGKIEVKEHAYQQKMDSASTLETGVDSRTEALEQELASVKDRLMRIEEYLNLTAGKKQPEPKPGTAPPPVKAAPESADQILSENELYARAKAKFDSGELEESREMFTQYLKRFPKAPSADAAQFWIGEIYYRQKWYEKAILEYQKVIETYPKGNKIQAALLKQGFSFYNLGDKANGRLVLKELVNKFPNSNEAKIAKQKLDGP
ncbi:MAG: tol-pal system protein YbgF [Desulfatirhabdiaceae bacterium]